MLEKNENVKDELLVCLQEYHKLVPQSEDGVLQTKFCVGKDTLNTISLKFKRVLGVVGRD